MRAVRLHQIGGDLRVDEVPDPVAAEGDVVVDVHFAAVNPLDVWIAEGSVGAAAANLPWVPGSEASGFLAGRPVLVNGAGLGVLRPGLTAQRVAVPRGAVIDLPAGTDLAAAAGIGVAGITAWHAVNTIAKVAPGDRVLVLGASGGVGAMAVQLAKAAGGEVWGQTGNAAKAAAIVASGADRAVVADADGLGAALRAAIGDSQPTVAFDALGGGYTQALVDVLAPRGRLAVYGTSAGEVVGINLRTFYRKGLTMLGYTGLMADAIAQAEVRAGLLAEVAAGRLRVPYELVALSAAAGVHRRIKDRQVEGKLIIDLTG